MQLEEVVRLCLDTAPGVDLLAGLGKAAHDRLGSLLVVPEAGLGGLAFEFGYLFFEVGDVKDGGGRVRCAPGELRVLVCLLHLIYLRHV